MRITVERIEGFCDLPVRVGDYFEVDGGRILVPPGGYVCMWALQSMMPLLPALQREIPADNDWLPRVQLVSCPDPKGRVIYRITRVGQIQERSRPRWSRILLRQTRCDMCGQCVTACAESHQGIPLMALGGGAVQVCRQCGIARCVEACPEGALSRDGRTGAVLVDESLCRGCGACAESCSFGGIALKGDPPRALVCDLCGGRPRCVEACPQKALEYG